MPRRLPTLLLLLALLGSPLPSTAQAGNLMGEMARAMLLMMEMFGWMLGGSHNWNSYPSGWGAQGYGWNNPYLSGLGLGGPYGAGLLNPAAGLGGINSPYGWGGGMSPWQQGPGYGALAGLYPGLPGRFPFNGLYGQGLPYGYGAPYRSTYGPGYGYAGPYGHGVPPLIVVQPVIIERPAAPVRKAKTTAPRATAAPVPGSAPRLAPPAPGPLPPVAAPRSNDRDYDRLQGEWLGTNGELLVFDGGRFRMADGQTFLDGRYRLNNGILRAVVPESEQPVYMQYRFEDDHLMFRSEDDAYILFRRVR